MKRYAVIENSVVVNLIMADSKEIAEEIIGKECIEAENLQIVIDSVLVGGVLKPYASWVLNDEGKWVPPMPYPDLVGTGKYAVWNEENINYELFDLPEHLRIP